jgi:hypothetical protein
MSEQIRDNHTLVNMAPGMTRLAYPRLQAELLHVAHARVLGRISREGSERPIGQRRQTQEEFTWVGVKTDHYLGLALLFHTITGLEVIVEQPDFTMAVCSI